MLSSAWHFIVALTSLVLLITPASAYLSLSNDTLLHLLPQPRPSDFDIQTGPLLAPILIPRVPGTPGSTAVLNHLASFFRTQLPEWTLTTQNSTFTTPVSDLGDVPFRNLIATRDPPGTQPGNVGRLTLVAHYDSKYTPDGFIGATDSAAPCAMILHAVRALDTALTTKWAEYTTQIADLESSLDFSGHVGLQVLFLDGEEAFQAWSATDSIYGARALASEWDTTFYPAQSTYKTPLDAISLFVLLDLLGSGEESTSTPVPSWMQSTHWAYQHMARAETRLRQLGLFQSHKAARTSAWLVDAQKPHTGVFNSYYMQDDHLPFVARGVECLHLIPSRFPSVWHTILDDGEHLDPLTVQDWALLTSVFVAEWMELEGFFAPELSGRETGLWGRAALNNEIRSKTEL